MPLDIKKLEAFFGSRLQCLDAAPSRMRWLTHFDGFVHWHVLWVPERELLKISADRDARLEAFPTVEVEGFYSSVSILALTGGATALVLQPVGAHHSMNFLVVTRTVAGRLSLSTTCGHPQHIVESARTSSEDPATPMGNSEVMEEPPAAS